MKTSTELALFGDAPLFDARLPAGQQYFPPWSQYVELFRDIFERQYYTNHGPLAQELERRLADHLNVRHAICVTNEVIGLALAGQALGIRNSVIVPGLCAMGTPESLDWTEGRPLFCDVDPRSGLMTVDCVTALLDRQRVSAILAVNPWGDAVDAPALEKVAAQFGIPIYFDSAHGFDCELAGRRLGGFGALEVISFESSNIVGACEGGVICTQEDDLAARIRNMRSNYGMGPRVPVARTGNGRMSEAQAAIALFNLDELPAHRERNRRLAANYAAGLAIVPGIAVRTRIGASHSNDQSLICLVDESEFGLSRHDLLRILRAENVEATDGFGPPAYRRYAKGWGQSVAELPGVDQYSTRVVELPMHSLLADSDVEKIVELIASVQHQAPAIRKRLVVSV